MKETKSPTFNILGLGLVRVKSDERLVRCESDFDEIIQILIDHNAFTVLPENPQTLH